MRKLLFLAFLATGCATTYSAGGHIIDGCEATTDRRAPGYTVYVCPRPFQSQWTAFRGQDCSNSTHEASQAKGPYTPCGWTPGVTDRAHREIFVQDVFLPENLDHEILHATGRIRDDE